MTEVLSVLSLHVPIVSADFLQHIQRSWTELKVIWKCVYQQKIAVVKNLHKPKVITQEDHSAVICITSTLEETEVKQSCPAEKTLAGLSIKSSPSYFVSVPLP